MSVNGIAGIHFSLGYLKEKLNDFKGALTEYTIAAETYGDTSRDVEIGDLYHLRGLVKMELADFKGALKDFDKSIKISPTGANYCDRGRVKFVLSDYKSAISDYDSAMKNNNEFKEGLYNRGIAKLKIGDKSSACQDLGKACKLGSEEACEKLKTSCK